MDIKRQVIEYITLHPGCSYVELERFFDNIRFEWRGDMTIVNEYHEHIVFWTGWNQQAANVVRGLEKMGQITKSPAHPLVYLVDGKSLTLPKVKSNRDYKTDHWLPVVFSVA